MSEQKKPEKGIPSQSNVVDAGYNQIDDDNEIVASNQLRRMWHSFTKRKIAVLGLIIVALFVLMAIFADVLAPYDPTVQDIANKLQGPSAEHLLGTDETGRDLLSRIIYGARISMKVGVVAVGVAFIIGTPIGICAGYFGGKIDSLLMRAMDVLWRSLEYCLLFFLSVSLDKVLITLYCPSAYTQYLTLQELQEVKPWHLETVSLSRQRGR